MSKIYLLAATDSTQPNLKMLWQIFVVAFVVAGKHGCEGEFQIFVWFMVPARRTQDYTAKLNPLRLDDDRTFPVPVMLVPTTEPSQTAVWLKTSQPASHGGTFFHSCPNSPSILAWYTVGLHNLAIWTALKKYYLRNMFCLWAMCHGFEPWLVELVNLNWISAKL